MPYKAPIKLRRTSPKIVIAFRISSFCNELVNVPTHNHETHLRVAEADAEVP
jgi:hypothetical protein